MQYLIMGINEINKELFNSIKNCIYTKPTGGLWASPYTPNKEFKSDWIRWCSSEMPDWLSNYGVLITLKSNSKGIMIDNYLDLNKLHNAYPGDYSFNLPCINFEAIAREYDVIYLSRKGEIETRYTQPSFYGWDCECILMMNLECIESWEYIEI